MMTGKLLLAVFIACFLTQENGAVETYIAETSESYLNLIDAFLDLELKHANESDQAFLDAFQAAETRLKYIQGSIPDNQMEILRDLTTNEKNATISIQQLLSYLKNSAGDFMNKFESETSARTQELKDNIKDRVKSTGGNMEKLNSCSQKYDEDVNVMIDWLLAGQAACGMDLIGDGVLIIESIMKVIDQLKDLLTAISVTEKNGIDTLMEDIKQLSGGIPVSEAYNFMESPSQHNEKMEDCASLKVSAFLMNTLPIIKEIADCTKDV